MTGFDVLDAGANKQWWARRASFDQARRTLQRTRSSVQTHNLRKVVLQVYFPESAKKTKRIRRQGGLEDDEWAVGAWPHLPIDSSEDPP